MLVTNHVLAGALVGRLVKNPPLALVLGVASHFAMDSLRHWGTKDHGTFLKVAVVDGLVGLSSMGAALVLAGDEERISVLMGMVGASLPDLDKPSELFFGVDPSPAWWGRFHAGVQRESPGRLPQEVLVMLGLGAVYLLGRPGRASRS